MAIAITLLICIIWHLFIKHQRTKGCKDILEENISLKKQIADWKAVLAEREAYIWQREDHIRELKRESQAIDLAITLQRLDVIRKRRVERLA